MRSYFHNAIWVFPTTHYSCRYILQNIFVRNEYLISAMHYVYFLKGIIPVDIFYKIYLKELRSYFHNAIYILYYYYYR